MGKKSDSSFDTQAEQSEAGKTKVCIASSLDQTIG